MIWVIDSGRGRAETAIMRVATLLLLVACSSSSPPTPDAASTDAPLADAWLDAAAVDAPSDAGVADARDLDTLSCAELARLAKPKIDEENRCQSASDCVVLGPQPLSTCNGLPTLSPLGECFATVNMTAGRNDLELQAVSDRFWAKCQSCTGDTPCVVDCAPVPNLQCLEGRCRSRAPSCLPTPPDAGS